MGEQEDIVGAMQAIGWEQAKPITVRSSLGIVSSVLINRPDPRAPVSALFYDGRREDIAFERASSADGAITCGYGRRWRSAPRRAR